MLKSVFFDLDGTLLPMDENIFTKSYFNLLCKKAKPYGYEPQKLIEVVWGGVNAMYHNNGSKTNEEAFWQYFISQYGNEKIKDKEIFNSFYVNEFKNTKETCSDNPYVKDIIKFVKENNLLSILSTNPIFPLSGTLTRMNFIGLTEKDFDYITCYENSSYCKPNPKYFQTLLDKFNLKPDEVIVFGNNDIEDYLCCKQSSLRCYLVGNNLILHPEQNIDCPTIALNEIVSTIKKYL